MSLSTMYTFQHEEGYMHIKLHQTCTIRYWLYEHICIHLSQILFKKAKAMTAEDRNQMPKHEDNSRGGNKTGKEADLAATHSSRNT